MASDFIVEVKGIEELAHALNMTADEMNLQLDNVIKLVAKEAIRDFKRSTKTWRHQPNFQALTEENAAGATAIVGTDDKIYGYVDQGTRVRRALMSPDFTAKTRPGWLGSRSGRGGVVYISKKLARPGIQARGFTQMVYERAEKRLIKKSASAVQQAINKAFG